MDRVAMPIQDKDYAVIREWYRGWLMTGLPRELLSDTGMIVPGVCAGWLYLTNSGVGLIENYISNPETSKELRTEGLDELTHALLALAKEKGCSIVRSETRHPAIADRCMRFNFRELPESPMRVFIRRME